MAFKQFLHNTTQTNTFVNESGGNITAIATRFAALVDNNKLINAKSKDDINDVMYDAFSSLSSDDKNSVSSARAIANAALLYMPKLSDNVNQIFGEWVDKYANESTEFKEGDIVKIKDADKSALISKNDSALSAGLSASDADGKFIVVGYDGSNLRVTLQGSDNIISFNEDRFEFVNESADDYLYIGDDKIKAAQGDSKGIKELTIDNVNDENSYDTTITFDNGKTIKVCFDSFSKRDGANIDDAESNDKDALAIVFGYLNESATDTYAVMLTGGSIGETLRPRNAAGYVGLPVPAGETLLSYDDALAKRKRLNSMLSVGEKTYYGLKYVVVAASDGKFVKASMINESTDIATVISTMSQSDMEYFAGMVIGAVANGACLTWSLLKVKMAKKKELADKIEKLVEDK